MVASGAYLVMFADEADEQSGASPLPDGAGQNLYAVEAHPAGSAPGAFDATLEEVLQVVSHVGLGGRLPGGLRGEP